MRYKRHAIVDKCSDALYKAFRHELDYFGSKAHSVCADIYGEDGVISISVDESGIRVDVIHNETDHESPTLKAVLSDSMPSWEDMLTDYYGDSGQSDEWDFHGFASEADYYHYRYSR